MGLLPLPPPARPNRQSRSVPLPNGTSRTMEPLVGVWPTALYERERGESAVQNPRAILTAAQTHVALHAAQTYGGTAVDAWHQARAQGAQSRAATAHLKRPARRTRFRLCPNGVLLRICAHLCRALTGALPHASSRGGPRCLTCCGVLDLPLNTRCPIRRSWNNKPPQTVPYTRSTTRCNSRCSTCPSCATFWATARCALTAGFTLFTHTPPSMLSRRTCVA